MADFVALATGYVLADGDDEQRELAGKAADGIRNAPRKSAAVLNWAQSINQWMPGNASSDADDDVIVRAKALGFLAATLEVLDDDVLRVEQIEHLIAFFGAMFAIDHKAGVLAAATALRRLCSMTHFRPDLVPAVVGHVVKLGEDFRLQAPATRRAIYELLGGLLGTEKAAGAGAGALAELHRVYGPSCGFLVDLMAMCRHERDPDNLLRWFALLRCVLDGYGGRAEEDSSSGSSSSGNPQLSPDVVANVFKATSDYFPISMRTSATPAGTTVDDLKTGLRACFGACWLSASAVFDFLLAKLDQGDALTVSVKADILQTMRACIASFRLPAHSVAPHAARLWNSLKYEVRHGEVPESVAGTLAVMEALARRLQGPGLDPKCLRDLVGLVLADGLHDLSAANGTASYAPAAGQLILCTVRGGGLRAFNLAVAPVLATVVKETLPKTQSMFHKRDLLAFLADFLRTRQGLLDDSSSSSATELVVAEFHRHDGALAGLLDSVYLSLWKSGAGTEDRDPVIRSELIKGMAELVRQQGPSTADASLGRRRLLICSPGQCTAVLDTLAPCMQFPFHPEASTAAADHGGGGGGSSSVDLPHEAVMALQKITAAFPDGFPLLVQSTLGLVHPRLASLSAPEDEKLLQDLLWRLDYIGCAASPASATTSSSGQLLLRHFRTLTQALLALLEQQLDAKASFAVADTLLSGIYGAMLHLREALEAPDEKTKKKESRTRTAAAVAASATALAPLQQDYLGQALAMVRRLYLRATASSSAGDGEMELSADFALSPALTPAAEAASVAEQDRYLQRLAGMGTYVVRDLDADQQVGDRLYEAPFTLFHGGSGSGSCHIFHSRQQGRVDMLAASLWEGLWPSVVGKMPASPLLLLEDFDSMDRLPARTRSVRNRIAVVVANKYSAAAATATTTAEWQKTVAAVQDRLAAHSSGTAPLTVHQFARLAAVASGALARLDKEARPLATLLARAPGAAASAASTTAEPMARLLRMLVSASSSAGGLLSPESHAMVKPIYRQWVYGQTVQVLLPEAFRRGGEGDRKNNTVPIAVLAMVRFVPFSVYEDDLDALVRILVVGVSLPASADVAAALRTLAVVLTHRAEVLQGHLRTLVDAVVRVVAAPSPAARELALALVAQLPAHFDETQLAAYAPRLSRALATSCGDPVREIRAAAQAARESWSKIGQ